VQARLAHRRRLRARQRGDFDQGQDQPRVPRSGLGDPAPGLRPQGAAPHPRVQPQASRFVLDSDCGRGSPMSNDEHDLEVLIASRFPIIALESEEEARALALLRRCAQRLRLPVCTWSITSGLSPDPSATNVTTLQEPGAALRAVGRSAPGVYVWLDFHPFL